eukprot:5708505-Amphidinium_carterae.1
MPFAFRSTRRTCNWSKVLQFFSCYELCACLSLCCGSSGQRTGAAQVLRRFAEEAWSRWSVCLAICSTPSGEEAQLHAEGRDM